MEGQTDGQETGTQEDFTAPGAAGTAAALDLGRGCVGYVRWLLELFSKQVVLETWRWGSVTLDMSQRSFLDFFVSEAETKMKDLNAGSVEAAMSMIAGTARSMGVVVVD